MTQEFIEELSEVSGLSHDQLPDFRSEALPGETIYETELDGVGTATWKKPRSKMRMGDYDLPDRVWLYDVRFRNASFVPPTIAQKRMMDWPGRFSMRKPAGWDESGPKPIDDTCEICRERRERESPGSGPKKFYSGSDLRNHYRLMHTLEWEAIEADRRDAERREEQTTMRGLLASIVGLLKPAGVEMPAAVAEQIAALQATPEVEEAVMPPPEPGPLPDPEPEPVPAFTCEVCGKVLKKKVALVGHMRSHK